MIKIVSTGMHVDDQRPGATTVSQRASPAGNSVLFSRPSFST